MLKEKKLLKIKKLKSKNQKKEREKERREQHWHIIYKPSDPSANDIVFQSNSSQKEEIMFTFITLSLLQKFLLLLNCVRQNTVCKIILIYRYNDNFITNRNLSYTS